MICMTVMPATRAPRPRVAIVYRIVPRYRQPFYDGLRNMLDERGIDLDLVYGQPTASDTAKADTVEPSWGRFVRSRIVRLGRRELHWQPILGTIADADLVIVEQASKLLVNYVLLAQQALGRRKVAFWGHGRNFQTDDVSAAGEWIKRLVSTRVHWWFAYNATSAQVVAQLGFPVERITNVKNAIDTRELIAHADALGEEDRDRLRRQLGLVGRHVGVYLGGMYPGKGLAFLLTACERVRASVPDFEAVFIGAGVDQELVESAAARHDWLHYVGPRHGRDKALYAGLGQAMLMPRLVGLAVLDAFALGLPMVTTTAPGHGPEIEYLRDDVNGVVVTDGDDPDRYGAAVAALMLDDRRRERLREHCLAARDEYSIEEMVARFADGIEEALAS